MATKSDLKNRFARNLKAIRVRLGMTQEVLAENAGVSLRYLQRLEQLPAKNVSLKTVDMFAKALGVVAQELTDDPAAKGFELSKDEIDALKTTIRILSSLVEGRR